LATRVCLDLILILDHVADVVVVAVIAAKNLNAVDVICLAVAAVARRIAASSVK
jgi:hypothetical protein